MGTVLKNVRIIDTASQHHNSIASILIEGGKIIRIGKEITEANHEVFEKSGTCVSAGWIDSRTSLNIPGNEHKEDIKSALNSALAGGFTKVVNYFSQERPCNDTSSFEYINGIKKPIPIDILSVGSISKRLDGEEMSDMFELHQLGAVGFTDLHFSNPANFKTALEYVKNFRGLIIDFPTGLQYFPSGIVHEGKISTNLGLKGSPSVGELMAAQSSINLLNYTESKLHLAGISTKEVVDLISKEIKNNNLSADVSFFSLVLTDESLDSFDTNFKVLPFLRTENDRKSLVEGVKNGIIKVISSGHQPQNIESKDCEFEHSEFGMIGMEFLFPVLNKFLVSTELELEHIINAITIGPRSLLGLNSLSIEEGSLAELTLFNPDESITIEQDRVKSKSKNSPFIGMELKGRVLGIFKDEQLHLTIQ